MAVKKWRPKREHINYWANWFKDHLPICHPQDLGNFMQNPHQAIETFWEEHKEHFREKRVSKEFMASAFAEVIRKMEIYPYKERKERFFLDVHFELGKALYKLTSLEFITLEESEKEQSLLTDQEETLIDQIDQERERDPEKLRQKGMPLREIEKKTGIPRSTLHRKLKKPKK